MSHIGEIATQTVPICVQPDAKLANSHLYNSYCAYPYLPSRLRQILIILFDEINYIIRQFWRRRFGLNLGKYYLETIDTTSVLIGLFVEQIHEDRHCFGDYWANLRLSGAL